MSIFAKASADSLRILYFGRVFGEIWLSSVLACQPEPSQRLAESGGEFASRAGVARLHSPLGGQPPRAFA